jgi:hypothetical protein
MRKLEMRIEAISLSPRTLRVGQHLIISSSEGWAGIESGCIKIHQIVGGRLAPQGEVARYNEMELEGSDMGEPIDFNNEYWVEFLYTKNWKPITGSTQWVPLLILEDHISVA